MDQSRPNNGLRLAGITLFSALALTACGGGGGGANPDVQANPQSVYSAYTAIETRSLDATGSKTQLQVVDLRNGVIARRYDLPAAVSPGEYPSPSWVTIFQANVDADGLGFQQTGASQLALVQSGKLMLLDLNGTTLGTARQLSAATDVCGVDRRIAYLSADGRHAWLRIVTAGVDHDCSQSADNVMGLVSTDMTPSDAPVASGLSSGLSIAAVLRDKAGQSQNLLVLDRDRHALAVYSNDLKTLRHDVPLNGQPLAGTEAVRVLVDSAVSYQQGLLQVGAKVYLADWSGAVMTLSQPIISTLRYPLVNSQPPVAIAGNNRFYVGDGVQGYAIDGSGQLLANFTFPAERGDIVEIAATNHGVLVNQTIVSGSGGGGSSSAAASASTAATVQAAVATPPVSTLWSVNGNTAQYFELTHSNGTAPFYLQSVRGDTLVFSQASGVNSIWSAVYKASATSSFALQTVDTGVQLVDAVRNPHSRAGTYQVDKLLWCKPTSYVIGCANGTLTTYSFSTEHPTPVGTMAAADAFTTGSKLFGVRETWTGRNSVLNLIRFGTTGYSSDLWMLNPDTGNSLQRLTPLP